MNLMCTFFGHDLWQKDNGSICCLRCGEQIVGPTPAHSESYSILRDKTHHALAELAIKLHTALEQARELAGLQVLVETQGLDEQVTIVRSTQLLQSDKMLELMEVLNWDWPKVSIEAVFPNTSTKHNAAGEQPA